MTNQVSNIKKSLGLSEPKEKFNYNKLLSIHLQSNDPDNFSRFIKSIEKNVENIDLIEIVVKIDDTDINMNDALKRLVKESKVSIKYISTPLLGDFSDLWRSMNDMLLVCEKDTYFIWNMNDEMRIPVAGWDNILKNYVGIFPDDLFRLRTSRFKYRNYSDPWECCFAPETSAITTKKWIETSGNWNPTLGPDTFNQLVAYYFSYHDRFNGIKETRDIIINDFVFEGEGASLGYSKKEITKRLFATTNSWFKLVSYKTQLEASKRSQLIKAQIYMESNYKQSPDYKNIKVVESNKNIYIKLNQVILSKFPYKISRLKISIGNFIKSFQYFKYGGGGKDYRKHNFASQSIITKRNIKLYFYSLILRYKLKKTYNLYRLYSASRYKINRKYSKNFLYKFIVFFTKILPRTISGLISLLYYMTIECAKLIGMLKNIVKFLLTEIYKTKNILFFLITAPLFILKFLINFLWVIFISTVSTLFINIPINLHEIIENLYTNKLLKIRNIIKNVLSKKYRIILRKIIDQIKIKSIGKDVQEIDNITLTKKYLIDPVLDTWRHFILFPHNEIKKKYANNIIYKIIILLPLGLFHTIFQITSELIYFIKQINVTVKLITKEILIFPLKIIYIILSIPSIILLFNLKTFSPTEIKWQIILLRETKIKPYYRNIRYFIVYICNVLKVYECKINYFFELLVFFVKEKFNFTSTYEGNTDLTYFFNKLNYFKLLRFLRFKGLNSNVKLTLDYIRIVILCKFYNIHLENILDKKYFINSIIKDLDDIFINFESHKSKIIYTDDILMRKLNYNFKKFIK